MQVGLNPALAVRRLARGITDVAPFTYEEREALMTLEKYNRFVPNLIREDRRALLEASKKAIRSGSPEINIGEIQ